VSERVTQRVSRLPRRLTQQPSVKELVKKYQEFLPPDGVQELTKTAFAPNTVVSESEPEYGPVQPRATMRSKNRHHVLSKMSSVSDFEQGYAANVAPRYLHSRRNAGHVTHGSPSRIPGPVAGSSLESSRRPSPEKHTTTRTRADETAGKPMVYTVGPKTGRNNRARPLPPTNSGKSNFRRPTGGTKVSSITKHFERINRDNEKANRRYAVIRGRRARPVATARAKVEILESIKDAINDESESSDSSEADDEGDGSDKAADKRGPEVSEEAVVPVPECIVPPPDPLPTPPIVTLPEVTVLEDARPNAEVPPPVAPVSLPPSPLLVTTKTENIPPLPAGMELEPAGAERVSILKAISGLWLQQQSRNRDVYDADDPMSDPEHIFRDSSMVVRTDEPTSIIALAIK
jgi:1-phosphatidylinositol-3-phosphate 5-kinase